MPSAPRLARGCRDVRFPQSRLRQTLLSTFSRVTALHGCRPVETPIIEPASLYTSLGSTSEIALSQTYHLSHTSPSLVLRPEGTAGVARALSSDPCTPAHPHRVSYHGPMFRRERPQRGRLRQFTQLGVEFIHTGLSSVSADPSSNSVHVPFLDAQLIILAHDLLAAFNLSTTLRLNSLGCPQDRHDYNKALEDFLQPRVHQLSTISRTRFESGNCLRILDSTLAQDRRALQDAPSLNDFESDQSQHKFSLVCTLLQDAGVSFIVDKRLVRGLDYYTDTAFEFHVAKGRHGMTSAGGAVCAGGRYADVAGASGVGFACGLERIELAVGGGCGEEVWEEGIVVVVGLVGREETHGDDGAVGRMVQKVVADLRAADVAAVAILEVGKVGKAVGRAVRTGAAAVVVVGEREVTSGVAQVKIVGRGRREEGEGEGEREGEGQWDEPVGVEVGRVGEYVRRRTRCL